MNDELDEENVCGCFNTEEVCFLESLFLKL